VRILRFSIARCIRPGRNSQILFRFRSEQTASRPVLEPGCTSAALAAGASRNDNESKESCHSKSFGRLSSHHSRLYESIKTRPTRFPFDKIIRRIRTAICVPGLVRPSGPGAGKIISTRTPPITEYPF
jgi:hypothetical protein